MCIRSRKISRLDDDDEKEGLLTVVKGAPLSVEKEVGQVPKALVEQQGEVPPSVEKEVVQVSKESASSASWQGYQF